MSHSRCVCRYCGVLILFLLLISTACIFTQLSYVLLSRSCAALICFSFVFLLLDDLHCTYSLKLVYASLVVQMALSYTLYILLSSINRAPLSPQLLPPFAIEDRYFPRIARRFSTFSETADPQYWFVCPLNPSRSALSYPDNSRLLSSGRPGQMTMICSYPERRPPSCHQPRETLQHISTPQEGLGRDREYPSQLLYNQRVGEMPQLVLIIPPQPFRRNASHHGRGQLVPVLQFQHLLIVQEGPY